MLRSDPIIRFGLIALATDMTVEGDAARLLPSGCQAHVTRIAFDNPVTPESLRKTGPLLSAAADLILPEIPLRAIIFACTSASAVLGPEVVTALGGRAPVVTPLSGALRGFEAMGIRRIALMTPYFQETTNLVGDYLATNGVSTVSRVSLGHADDRDMALITAEDVIDAAREADHPDAEALFLSCTALPAVPVIEEIERRLGKPVLSANQAALWAAMDIAGVPGAGVGQLFRWRTGAAA